MTRLFRSLLLVASLFAGSATVAVADPAPPDFPGNLRWGLVSQWIKWDPAAKKANITWPPNDGCASAPVADTLQPGQMIDRFGSEFGSFFSPKGEAFPARAVPYVCQQMDYRIYSVEKPIQVKECHAAPWFGEPGGAMQYQTAVPAADLVANGSIKMVTYDPAGSSAAAQQCGSP